MITVAIPNISETSEKTIQFLYQTIKANGYSVQMFIPNKSIYYKGNKKISLKRYIRWMHRQKEMDVLIVEFKKDALEKAYYQNIYFNITVLFEGKKRKSESHSTKPSIRLTEQIKSNYYVIPKNYTTTKVKGITYGWHKDADVSASSSQTEVDGRLQIQCCMEGREFSVNSSIDDANSLLAGIATLKLYGMDFNC